MPFVSAIIVAAGSSTRMGNIDKQFVKICDAPVIEHTLKAFASANSINEIIVVTKPESIPQMKIIADKLKIDKPICFVHGGSTRQQSVKNGIAVIDKKTQYIAVHDGARPLIKPDEIDALVNYSFKYDCITPGLPVTDTVKVVDENNQILSTPQRSTLRGVQTPQIFRLEKYLKALEFCGSKAAEFTDDCLLLEHAGIPVRIVEGNSNNMKITTQDDILKAEMILNKNEKESNSMRVGHGYDVHKLVENRKLIIGGVQIPYEKGLLGHSDADVLTHAVMDALLGAAALGDIGKLFPDNDDNFKDADSLVLLQKVCQELSIRGFTPINIDCTLIAQKPKLSPYIDQIRKNYSDIIGLDINCVNVKATTEEKLGFTGSGEGMSAHAVCLIKKNS